MEHLRRGIQPGRPGSRPAAACWLLWFLLALGGIFIVSALVGLLTSGLNQRLEQLRKGRSRVIETGHTVILGWSDQVFTVVSELVEANRSRRGATVVILAEQDKVAMEDRLRHRLETTRNTRVVCRTGSPLDLTDLEMVNLNGARSIIVLAPEGASAEDADAYVLKTLLAINRGPAFSADRITSWQRSGTAPTERWPALPAATRSSSTAMTSAPASSCRPRGSPGCRSSTTICSTSAATSSTSCPSRAWSGRRFGASQLAYRKCCPVGIYHSNGATKLNPPMDTMIGPNDKLVILAEDDSAVKLSPRSFTVDTSAMVHSVRGPQAPERTLMLGWNGRAVKIIEQLDLYVAAGSAVDIVTRPRRRRHGGGATRPARPQAVAAHQGRGRT